MTIFSKPFTNSLFIGIETLAAYEEAELIDRPIIEERGGIHYINQAVLNAGFAARKDLDNDFKRLVDSIIGKT